MESQLSPTARAFLDNQEAILEAWIGAQVADDRVRAGRIEREALSGQSRRVMTALGAAIGSGSLSDPEAADYAPLRELLSQVAVERERQGFSPIETASAILCLKDQWMPYVHAAYSRPEDLNRESVVVARLVDTLAMLTLEGIIRRREAVIARQSQEILDISTPVVQVWDGVVAAPLIGSLDSQRTQQFMELLLERIVDTNSPVALVDITGVPAIDTQTAQHLIETISAVRLLGAQVVLTGVRPQIAQTLVHLGIDLSDVVTRSSLAGGLRVALDLLNLQVVSTNGTGVRA